MISKRSSREFLVGLDLCFRGFATWKLTRLFTIFQTNDIGLNKLITNSQGIQSFVGSIISRPGEITFFWMTFFWKFSKHYTARAQHGEAYKTILRTNVFYNIKFFLIKRLKGNTRLISWKTLIPF